MNKIDVAQTIRAAYGFTFHHLGSVIGLIWLPNVVLTVLTFFVQEHYYPLLTDAMAAQDPASAGPAMLAVMFSALASLLLYAMMVVPVTQLALGTRQGGALVHIAFGAAEWRLFLSILALGLMLVIFLFLDLILAAFVLQMPAPQPVALAAWAGLIAAIVFCLLRFGFLLPSAAVTAQSNVLARSWAASAGNFWRILVVALAVLGPLTLLSLAAEIALLGPAAMMPQATASAAAAQMAAVRAKTPLLMGLGFLVSPFLLGLWLGAGAAAWKSLKGEAAQRNG